MNAIQHLLDEHKTIMAELAHLRRAVADLEARGPAALADALPVMSHIGRVMETRLVRHARKEDEVLFPALEAILGAHGSPISVMRREHESIHQHGALLRETLRELNEVEHPRIVAGGEALRRLAAEGGEAQALRATAAEILNLVDQHFGKEEQILFPMAEQLLDEADLQAVGRKIEELEAQG